MHVRLKNTFYSGPKFGRFDPASPRGDTVEMPDELRGHLPKSAEILDAPVQRNAPAEPEVDTRMDPENLEATADALADAERRADEQRAKNAERLRQRLEDEQKRADQREAEEQARLDEEEARMAAESEEENPPEPEDEDDEAEE